MRFGTLPGVFVSLALAGTVSVSRAVADDVSACSTGTTPPDERIAACTRAINSGRWKGSGLAWAYENRSIAYHDKGDLDRSKADFNQALKLYPPSHAEFTRCAGLYGDAAIAACTRAINSGAFRGDQLAKIYLNRGIEYGGKGNHDRAIEDFSEAIRLWPNYASAYYRRGLSERAKDDNTVGDADIAKAKQLDPDIK
jgi:tetratricopeptide (TPR) repeat protein